MKRGAEKQISKDDGDEDNIEDLPEPGRGLQKADEKVLASRPMRGLPRRSQAGSPAPTPPPSNPATPEPAVKPKFGSFGGFSAIGSTQFSFQSPSPSASVPNFPAPPSSAFSSAFSSTTFLPPPASSSTPAVSSSASAATKTFASFLGTSASTETPKIQANSGPTEEIKVETKYLTSIRGLNVSFLSSVSKAIDSDPFVDIAEVLERYKSFRLNLQSEYQDNLTKLKPINGVSQAPSLRSAFNFGDASSSAAASESQPKSPPSSPFPTSKSTPIMPTPPTSFSGFGPLSSSSSTPSTVGGFVSKTDFSTLSKSPFTFGGSSADSTNTSSVPKSVFGSGPSASSSSSSGGFTLGPSSVPSSNTTQAAFSFGGSSQPSSKPSGSTASAFGHSPPSAPSIFSSNLFGKPTPAEEAKESDKKETPSFGSTAFGGATAFTTPDKSSPSGSGFTFGASPSKPSLFGGMPKAIGSFGNPVGFGFGSPPKTPEPDTSDGASVSESKPSAFPFRAPSAFTKKDEEDASGSSLPSTQAGTGANTPSHEEPAQLLLSATSAHDAEGEGEEDEETTHGIRGKVFKMAKKGDGTQEWSDMGVGMLRLKKHKDTGARRVLLRNSSTGKIIINCSIHAGMNPSLSKTVVSFMGHDFSTRGTGAPTPYKVRVKTAEQAGELKNAFDREIAFVKSKSE